MAPHTYVPKRVLEYVHVYVQHFRKSDLKYKHSGATGKLPVVVGVYLRMVPGTSMVRTIWYVHVYYVL